MVFSDPTLIRHAQDTVGARARMIDYHQSQWASKYVEAFLAERITGPDATVVEAMLRLTGQPWKTGQGYLLAPDLTASVTAAAETDDPLGRALPEDTAPSDSGVLFLPHPAGHRDYLNRTTRIGALTWATLTVPETGDRS